MMTDRMRITFILPYAGIAGGIRVIAIYAQRLQQRGHIVRLISTPFVPWGRLNRARNHLHELLERFNLRLPAPTHLEGMNLDHVELRHAGPVTDADVPDGDVVVATWWETAPWVANLSASKGAKAYFVQDYGAHEGQPLDRVAQTWHLPLHKIVISRWLKGLVEKYSNDFDADYVPNAVDLNIFSAPPRGKQPRPTFGFVLSPNPQKGCDTILHALQMARQRIPDLHVLAFGPGEPGQPVPMPLGSKFFGCLPDYKLKDVYSACDAWLFGSRSEGFGLPILEAMACRTPVIGTPAGAAPDLLERGGGMLVNHDDPADMAAAIERIARMTEPQWQAMSESAFATASQFSWDHATDLFEAALQKAMTRQWDQSLAASA
jgi:glycosyltransferase involved in cell wall biosynthesis